MLTVMDGVSVGGWEASRMRDGGAQRWAALVIACALPHAAGLAGMSRITGYPSILTAPPGAALAAIRDELLLVGALGTSMIVSTLLLTPLTLTLVPGRGVAGRTAAVVTAVAAACATAAGWIIWPALVPSLARRATHPGEAAAAAAAFDDLRLGLGLACGEVLAPVLLACWTLLVTGLIGAAVRSERVAGDPEEPDAPTEPWIDHAAVHRRWWTRLGWAPGAWTHRQFSASARFSAFGLFSGFGALCAALLVAGAIVQAGLPAPIELPSRTLLTGRMLWSLWLLWLAAAGGMLDDAAGWDGGRLDRATHAAGGIPRARSSTGQGPPGRTVVGRRHPMVPPGGPGPGQGLGHEAFRTMPYRYAAFRATLSGSAVDGPPGQNPAAAAGDADHGSHSYDALTVAGDEVIIEPVSDDAITEFVRVPEAFRRQMPQADRGSPTVDPPTHTDPATHMEPSTDEDPPTEIVGPYGPPDPPTEIVVAPIAGRPVPPSGDDEPTDPGTPLLR